jgi:hypothetical protein
MQACLWRALGHAKALGRSSDWIWPDRTGQKPIDPARLEEDARATTGWKPQALRRSFATFAAAAGVSDDVIDRFLNHKHAVPITGRYIRTSGLAPFLREQQERISDHIIEALGLQAAKPVPTAVGMPQPRAGGMSTAESRRGCERTRRTYLFDRETSERDHLERRAGPNNVVGATARRSHTCGVSSPSPSSLGSLPPSSLAACC